MTIQVTRHELYRQVWARPAVQVAVDYGISNVALKKLCKRHGVPVPGRGYWARKTAGKRVDPAPPLGAVEASGPIAIRGSRLPDLPDQVREAQQRARHRESQPENRVEVSKTPAELHPAVTATWDALDEVEPNDIGLVAVSGSELFDVDVAQKRVPRTMLFLNALMVAADLRGYRLEHKGEALAFVVDGQAVGFKLLELVDRVAHTPTEEDRRAVREWESLQRMFAGAKNLDNVKPRPQIPEFDFVPTGRLQVVLAEGLLVGSGLRRVFADGERQQIEKLINPILVAMETWAAVIESQEGA